MATSNGEKSLESWIWDAACSIRGAKDAAKYKDFILPLIFTKRLCDVFDDELNRIAEEVGSRAKAFKLAKHDKKLVRFYLPLEPKNPDDAVWSVCRFSPEHPYQRCHSTVSTGQCFRPGRCGVGTSSMTELPQQSPTDPKANAKLTNKKRSLRLLYKVRYFLHQKWPQLVRHPNFEAELSGWRTRDAEENARTTPPDEEAIDLCCVWAVEVYSPGNIETLLDGLVSLGWGKSSSS